MENQDGHKIESRSFLELTSWYLCVVWYLHPCLAWTNGGLSEYTVVQRGAMEHKTSDRAETYHVSEWRTNGG